METFITMEPGVFEFEEKSFFDVDTPIYLLGRRFDGRRDFNEMKHFARSRIWLTYRKNFQAIGGTGPTSDQGWGCMLRCGQMLLAQGLIARHLGRDWTWDRDNPEQEEYWKILKMFADKKSALYSIHQIAQMGVSDGKAIGEWFGPNTVAQVLKKLAIYDDWSRLAVHVAMDCLLINEDVEMVAKKSRKSFFNFMQKVPDFDNFDEDCTAGSVIIGSGEKVDRDYANQCKPGNGIKSEQKTEEIVMKSGIASGGGGENSNFSKTGDTIDSASVQNCTSQSLNSVDNERQNSLTGKNIRAFGKIITAENLDTDLNEWHPILIVVPLRLGLDVMNECYLDAIKAYFSLPYSIGIIGGRPDHALYFIGICDQELIYLDPHDCQNAVDLDGGQFFGNTTTTTDDCDHKSCVTGGDCEDSLRYGASAGPEALDASYHCPFLYHMPFGSVDPSLALGFLCMNREEYMDLIEKINNGMLKASWPPLFEIIDARPKNWPRFQPYVGEQPTSANLMKEFTDLGDPKYDSDEEFEILE